jgi:hypothetical protein
MKNLLRKTMLLFFLSALIGTLTYAQQERDFKKLDEYIEKTRQGLESAGDWSGHY